MDSIKNETREINRSTGRGYFISSLVAAILSIGTLIAGLQVQTDPYAQAAGTQDYAAVSDRWWWFAVSSGAAGTAVLALVVGSIIRAIWFVTGEETKPIVKLLPNRNP